jgi:cob(I)alamin adenosyltransferase
VKIYTGKGDDGTTGLYFGGRVAKSSDPIEINGTIDEAQAALGVARAQTEPGSPLNEMLIEIERDLWTVMANVATLPENWTKLEDGTSRVTHAMVSALETHIDRYTEQVELPGEFVVPGENPLSASLDLARTIVRRAERLAVGYAALENTAVVPYLNRLSDLVWTLARFAEGPTHRPARRS